MADWGERFAEVVEIDIDQCTRVWGVAPCTAVLNAANVRKCYNSFPTCPVQSSYNKGVNTLRFCSATFPFKGGNYLPLLESVGGYEQTVNLNGFEEQLLGIGKRASVNIVLRDMPYNDVLTDKYWAERISGAAQTDEAGYNPASRGSFWGKLKARNPNFAGRIVRHIVGTVSAAGVFNPVETRVYVIEDIEGPVNGGGVTLKVKDILSLADNKKAMAPVTSEGVLSVDLAEDATTATLSPAGIGSNYPAQGHVCIGSEILSFTRAGNVLTFTGRGLMGSTRGSHSANDTVQLCYYTGLRTRIDTVIRTLLVTYGNVPAAYIDTAAWALECDRWGGRYRLTGIITKPEDVIKLLGEICKCFGVSLWWNPITQKIGMKLNHAIINEPIVEWNDRNNILKGGIAIEANDAERITRVSMNTVQRDATRGINEDNFLRSVFDIYGTGELPEMYGISRTEVINNRWLNHGDDTFAFILTGRLLARYKRAPATFTVDIDKKDLPSLVDVIELFTHASQDVTGKSNRVKTQVFNIKPDRNGTKYTVKMQEFLFTSRYGLFAPTSYPDYNSATAAQREHGTFFVGPSLKFSDGTDAYVFA